MTTILHLDSSGRYTGSNSRKLSQDVVDHLNGAKIIRRDLAKDQPEFVDEAWIFSNFTGADERSDEQKERLAQSDALISELQEADIIVIGVPMYNFTIPAVLKAWIDQVCRAGVTFKYTDKGPVGLLEGKRAILVHTTGGVPIGSPVDFCSDYMKHVLGFIGITEVDVISADALNSKADEALAKAGETIKAL